MMSQTLSTTDALSVVPLVLVQSRDFQQCYSLGIWWSQHTPEKRGIREDTYLPTCLLRGLERHAYSCTPDLVRDVAYCLGIIHGGILTETGTLRQGVTTLVHLQAPDIMQGYQAGRDFFFFDADTPEEWTVTEDKLLVWVQDILHDHQQHPNLRDIHFTLGDILGQLSGQLSPGRIKSNRRSMRKMCAFLDTRSRSIRSARRHNKCTRPPCQFNDMWQPWLSLSST